MQDLLYRRQFILGKRPIVTFGNWENLQIDEQIYLTIHPDLNKTNFCIENRSLTLLGYILDPLNPQRSNDDIILDILSSTNSFMEILSYVYSYSGRWILIYNDEEGTKIFHDPCGTRQIFYSLKGDIWCGSQPSILAEVLNANLDTNVKMKQYIESSTFLKNERQWYGDETIYRGIKHLLPNHYLDLKSREVNRYWIDKENRMDMESVLELASEIFKGSLDAINYRYRMMMPITAGWDSRLLLASSKHIKDNIFYYVSNMNTLSSDHRDIQIPRKLSSKLNFDFKVIENLQPLSKNLAKYIENNVTFGRTYLPKALTIQYHFDNNQDKINIGGNASGIVKMVYGAKHPENIDGLYLSNLVGLSSFDYIVETLNKWVEDVKKNVPFESGLDIPDLFYWEQRMGNWGTMYQAEQDIAIEEFLPFNNRQLIMLLAKVDSKYRSAPDYILYKNIIEYLWPDVLLEPFNPMSLKEKIRYEITKYIPKTIKRGIRKVINR